MQHAWFHRRLIDTSRVLSNFAFSFSIISVLTGVTTLYNTGLHFGGPVTMTFGWFVAGAFTMAVGLSMAEICSSFPTSGGLYYWSARLSGKRWAPFASWITGWYVPAVSPNHPSSSSRSWNGGRLVSRLVFAFVLPPERPVSGFVYWFIIKRARGDYWD
jgi:amino acid transporter